MSDSVSVAITQTSNDVAVTVAKNGEAGAAGPNEISNSTTTTLTGYLYGDGSTVSVQTPSGSGDVVGPSSAVDSRLAAFDTTTGKLLKDSGSAAADFATAAKFIAGAGALTGPAAPLTIGTAASAATADFAAASHALDTHSDVSGTPAVDNVLGWNGSAWVPVSGVQVGGSLGISFYMDDTAIIAAGTDNTYPVKTLSKTPVSSAEDVDTIACANNTVLYGSYLYDTALGATTIPAGTWEFKSFCAVSSVIAGRVSSLTRNVMRCRPSAETVTVTGTGTSRTATASGGTPFTTALIDASATQTTASWIRTDSGLYQITARTSDTVVTITTPSGYTNEVGASLSVWKKLIAASSGKITSTGTDYALYTTNSVQDAFTIEVTDKLAEMVYGVSNNTTNVLFVHNGTEHYSHFHTPLQTNHNDLPSLQGGQAGEYYHLTATQATNATTAAAAGTASIRAIGTSSTTAAAGDDSRITGAVQKATFDAHTVLAATSDDTPAALTVTETELD